MTNEEFLGYFSIHCRTDRALFSRDQIARLMRLTRLPDWMSMSSDTADPLIERARRRLKLRVIEGGKR